MRIPLNRFVTFVKPWLNLAAGAVAAWLVAKANVLGLPGLGSHQQELATWLAGAGVWVLTTVIAQVGDLKWLKGHHIELVNDGEIAAAALVHAPSLPAPPAGEFTDADADHVPVEDLPSDDEEFASPPPSSVQGYGPGEGPGRE